MEKPDTGTETVIELLDDRARETPDAPALSFPAGQATYSEVAAASRLAARQLHAAGTGPGDRVGILLREASVAFVTMGLGILRLGAICVPINARSKSHELGYVIDHSGLSLILTEAMFEPLLADANYGQPVRIVRTGDDPVFAEAASGVDPGAIDAIESTISPNTPSLLLYTSGTTASPKGCLHTHATMLASGRNTASRLELTPADRYWTALAMFHVGGWQVLMANLTAGSCFSHAGMFEPTQTLDQLERERVTVAMPAFELIWLGVLGHERFPEADLSALRIVMNVGVPERMSRMQRMVPQAVQISMIGMTECFGSICIGSPTASRVPPVVQESCSSEECPALPSTTEIQSPRLRRSTPMAGCTRGTSRCRTQRAVLLSSAGSRTC
jgi:fatty-acyl-CoA synthase